MSRLNESLEETKIRFLSKVDKDENGCWIWIASISKRGYPNFSIKGKTYNSHRISYVLFKGIIPTSNVIDHLCKNIICVNPSHLEAVTQRENLMRGNTQARNKSHQTHCIHGHPFNKENTYINPMGIRHCRVCVNISVKKYRFGLKKETYRPIKET